MENRINKQIQSKEVRLINLPEGHVDGIYSTEKALKLAQDLHLDLIEISTSTSPIVCKIMEYSKFKYELDKKKKENKKNQKIICVKKIRLSQNIGENDLQTKIKQSIEFLKKGDKIEALLFFKGRGIVYKDQGQIVLLKFADMLKEYGIPEKMPSFEGKKLSFIIKPKK